MRISLAFLLAAGLTGGALALQPATPPPAQPATPPPAQPAGQPTTQPAGQPPGQPRTQIRPRVTSQPAAQPAAQQPAHDPIPVPDGPVVKKTEVEGGLILEDIKIGDGYEAKPGDFVVVLYEGKLKENEKVIDSAFKRGEPAFFPLKDGPGGVITGWIKGVPGMKVGGIRKLTIPSAMGWGERGGGTDIPPNADVVFVIQLVDALQIEEVKVGEGEAASSACVAVTSQVVKDKDGKEVEKSDATKPYVWLPGEFQPMQFGLEGMKAGGKRKIYVPKEMNITNPALPTTRPTNVPLTIEFELVTFRNLPQRPAGR